MNKPARKTEWTVWGGLVLVILTVGCLFILSKLSNGASKHTAVTDVVTFDKISHEPFPVLGQLPDFTLTNQDGQAVSLSDLRGKVWVADIIFTRCPGPCPTMTHHLAELQTNLQTELPGAPVKFVTLTSDPENDTPAVLKRYSERFNADTSRWSFLTGPKPEIRKLAVKDFKFVVVEKAADQREVPNDLFIHSTWFVLVDKQGRVRGWTDTDGSFHAYYDSLDDAERARVLPAIKQLLRE